MVTCRPRGPEYLKDGVQGFLPSSHLHQAARLWAVVLLCVLISSPLCCGCLGQGQYAPSVTHNAACFVLYIERIINNTHELDGQIHRELYLRTSLQLGLAAHPLNPSTHIWEFQATLVYVESSVTARAT